MTQVEETVEGTLNIHWENYGDPNATPKYALLFSRYKNPRDGAQQPKWVIGDNALKSYLIKDLNFTSEDTRDLIEQIKEKQYAKIQNVMMPAQFLGDYEPKISN